MGYVAEQNGSAQSARRRMTVLTCIGLLHAGVLYVLVTELAGVVKMIEPPTNLRTHNDPITVPVAQPTAQPSAKPHAKTHPIIIRDPVPQAVKVVDMRPIDLPTPLPTIGVATPDNGIGDATPTPTPTPRFAPHNAMPRGSTGTWITPNDYPPSDLRQGNTGVTGFRLTIGRDGRPESCTITSSSGHPSLDAATCRLVSLRAQFKPATDDTGGATAGSYQSKVDWTIPER